MALIANLRHYLGEDLSLIKIPAPATGLREFLGCIVETVTSIDPNDKSYFTRIKCRKKCGQDLIAYYSPDDPTIIKWFCNQCDDEGLLSGWEETIWDKRVR